MRCIALSLTTFAALTGIVWIAMSRSGETIPSTQTGPAEQRLTFDSNSPSLLNLHEMAQLQHAHLPANPFWQSDPEAQAQRIEQIIAAERTARARVMALFGSLASEAPLFWRLFRPLHARVPHLSSADQVMIHELEQQFLADSIRQNKDTSIGRLHLAIRNDLGKETADEYALNTSPLADELRAADLSLTENEFREAFAAFSELGEATGSEQFFAARTQLREGLGNHAFAQLWSVRDPRFVHIKAVANRFDLTQATLLSAYALMLENQDAMITAAAQSDPSSQQEVMRRQYETGRRRLHELVGERAGDALLLAANEVPRQNLEHAP